MKRKRKLKKWVFIVILLIFGTFLGYGLFNIITWKVDQHEFVVLEKKIAEDVEVIEKSGDEEHVEFVGKPQNIKETDYQYYMKLPFIQIDFGKLKEKNSDTVGFLKVGGTNINYPIVYSGDNEYYLTHAFDKSSNQAGWVFMDYRNSLNDLSDNTIFYGHGRVDGTVFGSLKNVLTKSWQSNKENYIVQISGLTYNYVFEIFSVYSVAKESFYVSVEFENIYDKENWVKTIKARDEGNLGVDVSRDDYILTLSTCKDAHGEARIVAHAKLLKKESVTVQSRTL